MNFLNLEFGLYKSKFDCSWQFCTTEQMMKQFVPEGTEPEDVGDPAGELAGEAAADIQKVS